MELVPDLWFLSDVDANGQWALQQFSYFFDSQVFAETKLEQLQKFRTQNTNTNVKSTKILTSVEDNSNKKSILVSWLDISA